MARIRSIKPNFFTSDDTCRCSRDARLLFIGLWTEADREGRLEDRPQQIKTRLFPDEDDMNIGTLLDELHAAEMIERYAVGVFRVIQIRNFAKHQRPHPKEAASTLPPLSDSNFRVQPRQPTVFFIKDEARHAVKIGVAYRPDNQMRILQPSHNGRLEMIGTCPGGFPLERELHTDLVDYRLNGEWFELTEEVESRIFSRLGREKVSNHPVEFPSCPPGALGYGDLGEGDLGHGDLGAGTAPAKSTPEPARPLISGSAHPATWGRLHSAHVGGFCDFVCFPESVFEDFVRRVVTARGLDPEVARQQVKAWAEGVRKDWQTQGKIAGDDIFEFWRHEWKRQHGSNKPASGSVDVLAGLK